MRSSSREIKAARSPARLFSPASENKKNIQPVIMLYTTRSIEEQKAEWDKCFQEHKSWNGTDPDNIEVTTRRIISELDGAKITLKPFGQALWRLDTDGVRKRVKTASNSDLLQSIGRFPEIEKKPGIDNVLLICGAHSEQELKGKPSSYLSGKQFLNFIPNETWEIWIKEHAAENNFDTIIMSSCYGGYLPVIGGIPLLQKGAVIIGDLAPVNLGLIASEVQSLKKEDTTAMYDSLMNLQRHIEPSERDNREKSLAPQPCVSYRSENGSLVMTYDEAWESKDLPFEVSGNFDADNRLVDGSFITPKMKKDLEERCKACRITLIAYDSRRESVMQKMRELGLMPPKGSPASRAVKGLHSTFTSKPKPSLVTKLIRCAL